MKKATDIVKKVSGMLSVGLPVYITDGTVTRQVTDISYARYQFNSSGFLYVPYAVEGTNGYVASLETDMYDDLIGMSLVQCGYETYLAPDWWHAL